jgi:hypothetical protein
MLSSDIAHNDFALLVPGEGGYFPLGFAHSSRSKIAGVFDPPLRCDCNAVPTSQIPAFHRAIEADRWPGNRRFSNVATTGAFISKAGKITGKI